MSQSSTTVTPKPASFLPGWIITMLAVTCLVLAVALACYALFNAQAFPTSWEGFWICLLVGLLASVFYYGLFPQYSGFTIKLDRWGLAGPAVLIGPLAIWLTVTLGIWHFLPQTGRVYLLTGESFAPNMVRLDGWVPKKPGKYLQLVDPDQHTLAGVYLEFDDPLVLSYKVTNATVGDPPITKLKPIEFRRYESTLRSREQRFALEEDSR